MRRSHTGSVLQRVWGRAACAHFRREPEAAPLPHNPPRVRAPSSLQRRRHGHRHPPRQGPQGAAEGAQEPGHLPAPARQAVPVPGPPHQRPVQPRGAQAPLHEPLQPPPAGSVPPDPDDAQAGPGRAHGRRGRHRHRRRSHPGRAQAQGLCPAGHSRRSHADPPGRGLHPDLRPAGHGHPQGQGHRAALRPPEGARGFPALRESARDPPQPHQALRALQGPQVRARPGAPRQPGLQELSSPSPTNSAPPPQINGAGADPPPKQTPGLGVVE